MLFSLVMFTSIYTFLLSAEIASAVAPSGNDVVSIVIRSESLTRLAIAAFIVVPIILVILSFLWVKRTKDKKRGNV